MGCRRFPFLCIRMCICGSSRGVLMCSYRGAIHMMEVPIQLSLGVCLPLEFCQDMIPYPSLYPAIEAGGNALPGTKFLR